MQALFACRYPVNINTDVNIPEIPGDVLRSSSSWADPPFHFYLGIVIHATILRKELRHDGLDAPIAQVTALGWSLSEPIPGLAHHGNTLHFAFHCADHSIANQLRRFWEIEEAVLLTATLIKDETGGEVIFCDTFMAVMGYTG